MLKTDSKETWTHELVYLMVFLSANTLQDKTQFSSAELQTEYYVSV